MSGTVYSSRADATLTGRLDKNSARFGGFRVYRLGRKRWTYAPIGCSPFIDGALVPNGLVVATYEVKTKTSSKP